MITANEYFALKSWLEPWEVEARLSRAISRGWLYKSSCDICKVNPHKTFMVHNELWSFVDLPQKSHVCRDCFEGELGRALTVYDLIDVPMSDWLFLELLNGCDEETSDGISTTHRTLISTVPAGRAESMAIPGGWERLVAPNGAGGKSPRPNRRGKGAC